VRFPFSRRLPLLVGTAFQPRQDASKSLETAFEWTSAALKLLIFRRQLFSHLQLCLQRSEPSQLCFPFSHRPPLLVVNASEPIGTAFLPLHEAFECS